MGRREGLVCFACIPQIHYLKSNPLVSGDLQFRINEVTTWLLRCGLACDLSGFHLGGKGKGMGMGMGGGTRPPLCKCKLVLQTTKLRSFKLSQP